MDKIIELAHSKELFIGEFESKLLDGHQFALKLDFRKHKDFTEQDRIHQHIYAMFFLVGTVESSRVKLSERIDQILAQSQGSLSSLISNSGSLCGDRRQDLIEFQKIVENIGKYKLNEIIKSKNLFKTISESLKYLVFRNETLNINIRELLKRVQKIFDIGYDMVKTYSYRYIKIIPQESSHIDKAFDLLIEQALDENRVGTGVVYYVCKAEQMNYNGEKVQFMYSKYEDLIKMRDSSIEVVDADRKILADGDDRSWDSDDIEESSIIESTSNFSRGSSFDGEQSEALENSFGSLPDDNEDDNQLNSVKKFKAGFRQMESEEEDYSGQSVVSEVQDDGKPVLNILSHQKKHLLGQKYWDVEENIIDVFGLNKLSLQRHETQEGENLHVEKQRAKVEIVRQGNKNINVVINMTYKSPKDTIRQKKEKHMEKDYKNEEIDKVREKKKTKMRLVNGRLIFEQIDSLYDQKI